MSFSLTNDDLIRFCRVSILAVARALVELAAARARSPTRSPEIRTAESAKVEKGEAEKFN